MMGGNLRKETRAVGLLFPVYNLAQIWLFIEFNLAMLASPSSTRGREGAPAGAVKVAVDLIHP
jgi:hypothetical protein